MIALLNCGDETQELEYLLACSVAAETLQGRSRFDRGDSHARHVKFQGCNDRVGEKIDPR